MRVAEALAYGTIALAAAAACAQAQAPGGRQPPRASIDIIVPVDPLPFLEPDPAMTTPLHRAAAFSADPALVALLIARGADPDARDADGRTPLHAAAANPLAAVALLAAGADPCATDATGRPALAAATLEAIRRAAPEAYGATVAAFAACR